MDDRDLEMDDVDLEFEIEARILHSSTGEPLEDEIEIWVNSYFQSIMDILNSFYMYLTPGEAADRLELVSFTDLVREQLEGEPEAVVEMADKLINELKTIEVDFIRAYAE
ncbi:MAG: hypothetical protein ACM3NT_07445 [Methylocystaceae bacterium]